MQYILLACMQCVPEVLHAVPLSGVCLVLVNGVCNHDWQVSTDTHAQSPVFNTPVLLHAWIDELLCMRSLERGAAYR